MRNIFKIFNAGGDGAKTQPSAAITPGGAAFSAPVIDETETESKPPAEPVDHFPLEEGLEASAMEAAKRLGIQVHFSGFKREPIKGYVINGKPIPMRGVAIVPGGTVTADLILKCSEKYGPKLARGVDLAALDANLKEQKRRWDELEQRGHTAEHYNSIIAEDNDKRGEHQFKGLESDRGQLYAIVAQRIKIGKRDIRELAKQANAHLLKIAYNCQAALQAAMLKNLEAELNVASDWSVPFSPSILLCTIDNALGQLEVQIGLLKGGHEFSGTEFAWGLTKQLLEKL